MNMEEIIEAMKQGITLEYRLRDKWHVVYPGYSILSSVLTTCEWRIHEKKEEQ